MLQSGEGTDDCFFSDLNFGLRVGRSSGCSADCLSGRIVDRSSGLRVDGSSGLRVDSFSGGSVDRSSGRSFDRFSGRIDDCSSGLSADHFSHTVNIKPRIRFIHRQESSIGTRNLIFPSLVLELIAFLVLELIIPLVVQLFLLSQF